MPQPLPKDRTELLNALNLMEGQGASVEDRRKFVSFIKTKSPQIDFSVKTEHDNVDWNNMLQKGKEEIFPKLWIGIRH